MDNIYEILYFGTMVFEIIVCIVGIKAMNVYINSKRKRNEEPK